jgi:hypothetical protein
LFGFLGLELVGQLAFGFEPWNGRDFGLFALHQSFHQFIVIVVFLYFLFAGLIRFCGLGISL